MDWTKGYVADVGYTAGFFRQTTPSHMAFAALTIGRSPGRALKPARVIELGFGQGFGLALLAAANPDIAFEGYDFNPDHVAHARRLIETAGLANIAATEASFEDAAARGGDNNVDVIVMHGTFSWVSRATQDALIAIMRQRLVPDGIAYVSYNCMPGWAAIAPLRQLILAVKRRNPGSSPRQLSVALDLITELREGGAGYFVANPSAARHFDDMLKSDPVYLAHEYLDEHWELPQFSDVAARMSEAKLTFVASAIIPENLHQYAVPPALRSLVARVDDLILRETLSDFASNKRFRRDIYARGSGTLPSRDVRRVLSSLRFALAVPRRHLTFEIDGPLNKLSGQKALYQPIVDLLQQQEAEFDELLALPPFGEAKINVLLDCLGLLAHSGQVMPLIGSRPDAAPAQRFNRMIAQLACEGRSYSHLASPVGRTGIRATEFDLLTLAAIHDGVAEEPAAVASHILAGLKRLGRRPMKDGHPIEDDAQPTAFVSTTVEPILTDSLPLWRRLGVL